MSKYRSSYARSTDDTHSDSDACSSPEPKPPLLDYDQCLAAIKGISVPANLDSDTARYADIWGIRCSYELAINNAVEKLCASDPQSARARNARPIMSDEIPPQDYLKNPEYLPYCIWYPDIASEETYRTISHHIASITCATPPDCAATGYINLYESWIFYQMCQSRKKRGRVTLGGDKFINFDAVFCDGR
jgi:hypothetical protein